MKKYIVKLPFDKVQKLDIPDIVNGTLEIVAKHKPGELHIEGMFNLLQAETDNMQRISEVYNSHPLTPVIRDLRNQSDKIALSILAKTRTLKNLSSLSSAEEEVKPVVERFFKGFRKLDRRSKNECVAQFLKITNNEVNLAAAIQTSGLKIYTDELRAIQQKITLNTTQRRASSSVKTIKNRKAMKIGILTATSNLYDAVELARVEHSDVDYMPLINELNKLLVPIKSDIRTRSTLNVKKAAKTKTVALSSQTTATAI